MIYSIDDFDLNSATYTGGKTGSVRITCKKSGEYYQLKPSILEQTLIRKIKANYTDRENFSEIISACVLHEFAPATTPVIDFVYDQNRNKISIVSKYLTANEVNTLSTELKSNRLINKSYRKGLAKVIAQAILIADHDIGPGNILILKDQFGKSNYAKIDFGHALNDLLNAPDFFVSKNASSNSVIDYINRPALAGVKLLNDYDTLLPTIGSRSKLWKYYSDFIPVQELVDSFKELSGLSNLIKIKSGLDIAKYKFLDLLAVLELHGDVDSIAHVKKSLGEIYLNITGEKIDDFIERPVTTVIEFVFAQLYMFLQSNLLNMQEAKDILQLQIDIDNLLLSPDKLLHRDLIPELNNKFILLCNKYQKSPDNFEWLKLDLKIAPVKGTLQVYINKRSKTLGEDYDFDLDQIISEHYSGSKILVKNKVWLSNENMVSIYESGESEGDLTKNLVPSIAIVQHPVTTGIKNKLFINRPVDYQPVSSVNKIFVKY